jgi:hypothetical protein
MLTCLNTDKLCKVCNQNKPFNQFYAEPRVSDGCTARCKACIKAAATARYSINKESILAENKAQYSPEKERAKKLHRTYGLSVELYDHMLKEQGYKCKLCSSTNPQHNYGRFVVDHCHTSGKVRGLLCGECNLMLGKSKDNVNTLQNAISYLAEYT